MVFHDGVGYGTIRSHHLSDPARSRLLTTRFPSCSPWYSSHS